MRFSRYSKDPHWWSVRIWGILWRALGILKWTRSAGLKLSPWRCKLFHRNVPYPGHVISAEGIAADPAEVNAAREWQIPKMAFEVRSFIGLCSYYRRFIKGFSKIARPLSRLTEAGRAFNWTSECDQAFFELRAEVTTYSSVTKYYWSHGYRMELKDRGR